MESMRSYLISMSRTGQVRKGEAILRLIGDAGDEGLSYSEIQRFICEVNGRDWEERQKVYAIQDDGGNCYLLYEEGRHREINGFLFGFYRDGIVRRIGKIVSTSQKRRNSGYYGTCLSRLLPKHCVKNEEGRWVLSYPVAALPHFAAKLYS